MNTLLFLLLAVSAADAGRNLDPPPSGPGNCYYAEDCRGGIKATSVSANYCEAAGGKSWKPRPRNSQCYNLGILPPSPYNFY